MPSSSLAEDSIDSIDSKNNTEFKDNIRDDKEDLDDCGDESVHLQGDLLLPTTIQLQGEDKNFRLSIQCDAIGTVGKLNIFERLYLLN